MKLNKKIFIVLLSLFYLLVIQKIISLYLFPKTDFNLFLNQTQEDFMPYTIIIKIIIILIALSLIPGYYILKKAFKEEVPPNLKDRFPILILAISAIIPALALLSTLFIGDVLFSSLILIYGILFTTITYKYRKLEYALLINSTIFTATTYKFR